MRKSLLPALALPLALAACAGGAPAEAPPLAGATMGGPFSLVDQNGRRTTDRDFAGKYRLVYFGFSYCPDVCPVDLAVIGQGALLLRDPASVENPFFHMAPAWALYPLVIMATLAAVIASQALISGAFSLKMKAVQIGYMPSMKIEKK